MKTFLSWLIANLEVAASVVILAVYIPIYVHGIKSELGSGNGWPDRLHCLAIVSSADSGIPDLQKFLVYPVLVPDPGCRVYSGRMHCPYATEDAYFQKALIKLVIGGILSFALAIPVGIFTARNMDDVVSLGCSMSTAMSTCST